MLRGLKPAPLRRPTVSVPAGTAGHDTRPKPAGLNLSAIKSTLDPALDDGPTPAEGSASTSQPQVPAEPELTEISGRVVRLIYQKDDYAVYAIRGSGENRGKEVTVAVTSAIKASRGDNIIAKGSWSTYKNRPTFKAVMIMYEVPKGAQGVVTWLGTKAAAGVGRATAKKLATHFGERLPEVISDPEKLAEAGIPMDKAKTIAEAWNTNAGQAELVEFLGRFGLGEMTIAKIVRKFGGASRRIVQENPWKLAEVIDGVGFKTADAIAFEANHTRDSERRIAAGLRWCLEQKTGKEGHCGLPENVLLEETSRLLELPRTTIKPVIEKIVDDQTTSLDSTTGFLFPVKLLRAETDLSMRLKGLAADGDRISEDEARSAIEKAIDEMGVIRDESQIEAGVMALTNPVSIITGGPGTGKSTIQRAVVAALEKLGRVVALASPTGRAAKRLAEVSGRPASTCHRLLSFNAEKGGFEFDASRPFEEDRFIIDEFSMVDLRLASSFFDAIKPKGGVTIVGDVDQLPSVGAGQVLRDLIESGAIPVTRLKTVHRQAGDSGIVVAAARINKGEHPIPDGDEGTLNGFEFEEIHDHDLLLEQIVTLMKDTLPEMGFDPIKDVQVLAAMRKGDLGIVRLNEVIKASLNPATPDKSVEIRKRVFSVGDRVMHLRNDYAKRVYNGEVGTVAWTGTRINDRNKEEPIIKVDYSGFEAFYGPEDIDDVELSWAATVHKSQGCEFPVVIFACPSEHRRMLTRNLLYTAVTRAKQKCIVIGDGRALQHAVRTADVNRRFTGLSKRVVTRDADMIISPRPS